MHCIHHLYIWLFFKTLNLHLIGLPIFANYISLYFFFLIFLVYCESVFRLVYLSHLAEKNVWSNKQSVYIWEGENWSDKLFKNYFSQQEWKLFVMFWWAETYNKYQEWQNWNTFHRSFSIHFFKKCLFRYLSLFFGFFGSLAQRAYFRFEEFFFVIKAT